MNDWPVLKCHRGLACLGIDRFEGVGIVGEEDESTRCGKRSSPRVAMTCLRILPDLFPVGRRERQEELSLSLRPQDASCQFRRKSRLG